MGKTHSKIKQDQPENQDKPAPPVIKLKKHQQNFLKTAKFSKLPDVYPINFCQLKRLKTQKIRDFLLIEKNFIAKDKKEKTFDFEKKLLSEIRGKVNPLANLDELIDDNHAIVSNSTMPTSFVGISTVVDKSLLYAGCTVLLHQKSNDIVGVYEDENDPMVSVMKVDKNPAESYASIGGLEEQIREVKESVELPLTRPELYKEIGVVPPKGVIFYGTPGTGKTLLAKAVAAETSATFLRVVGSELIQKYLGEGPKLVRKLFQLAEQNSPAIIFIDEIDAIGMKRESQRGGRGEQEIQRTMLELLNQLDGFDNHGDIKVIMATNRIESLDPALIRPGRIDRKIEFTSPDSETKLKIFKIHTKKMHLHKDVDLTDYIDNKYDFSGAEIKAICTEAGLVALRERRMCVNKEDFKEAINTAIVRKKAEIPEGMYS